MTIILTAVFGLLIGSFLNVCIYRIPLSRFDRWYDAEEGEEAREILSRLRKDVSIVSPARSFCPHCQHQLAWHENIPILSWLLLRGKCSACAAPISGRYPAVELLTAIAALLTLSKFGLTATGILIFIVLCVLIIITFIDYDFYVIPDELSIRGSIAAVCIALFNHYYHIFHYPVAYPILDSLLGILFGAGFLLFIYGLYYVIRRREGLGLGDVKLLLAIGALFGMNAVLYTIFVGSLLGSVIGIFLIVFGGRKLSTAIPFGPYLTFAAALYIFSGNAAFNVLLP